MEPLFNANNPYSAKILGEPTLRPAALAKSMQFQLPGPSEQSANELSGNQYQKVTSENVDKGGLASLKEIFTEMAYNIESIARNTLDTANFLEKMAPSARDKGISDADKKKTSPGVDNDSQGNKFKLEMPKVGPKTGLALMLLALGALFKYSDEIASGLATVLPYVKKFGEMLGPKGTLYLGLASLAAIIFPETFKTLLGAGVKGIKYAFTELGTGFKGMRESLGKYKENLKKAYTGGKKLITDGFTKLGKGFQLMRGFLIEKAYPAILSAFGGVKGKVFAAITKLGAAFTAMKAFLLTTMIPAITAFMGPFLVPLALLTAAVAAAVAIFYTIRDGIQAFKDSLAKGDTMLEAIIEGVSTALLTLVTLPITLIKNFVAWVAGKLGFEGIAEKLKEFSIVDFIKDGVKNLVLKAKDFILGLLDLDFKQVLGKFVDIGKSLMTSIKAIGAGALAAIKSPFSPIEGFKEGYDKYIKSNTIAEPEAEEFDIDADNTQGEKVALAKEEIKENEAEIEVLETDNPKIVALQARNAELLSMIYQNSLIQSDIAKKSLELQTTNSGGGGNVITTVNNTDASNTNNTSNNTTNTSGLAVTGTDSTAKALSDAGYGVF